MASDSMLAYNRRYAASKLNIFKMESSLVEMEMYTLHRIQLCKPNLWDRNMMRHTMKMTPPKAVEELDSLQEKNSRSSSSGNLGVESL